MSAKSTEKEATTTAANAAEQEMAAQGAADKPVETDSKATGQKAKAGKAVKAGKEDAKTGEKAAKKPAAKKTSAKKTEKPEPKTDIFIEYQGHKILHSEVVEKVKAAFVKSGHRAAFIKSMQIYIKPEEAKAYYVINDNKYNGDVDLY